MKHLIIIATVFFLASGCKKKDPIEIIEPPVFSFTGKINGNTVSYQAGIDNYFMYSSFQDSANVREFIGDLKKFGCVSGCNSSMKLRIRDYRTLSSAATDPDTSIATDYYAYSKPSGAPSAYNVTFATQFSGGTPQTRLWTFPDGSTSTSSIVVKSFPRNGLYDVCLSITSTSACVSSICNTVFIGQTGNAVQGGILNFTGAGTAVTFTAAAFSGVAPFTYLWNFGDGNTSTLQAITHTYSAAGVYPVTLTVTDANGKTGVVRKNVPTQTPGSCATNFSYSSMAIANPLNLSNVILEWTDPNGVVYSSENNSQPTTSGFKIINVEDYKSNSSGQKTKKIRAVANCTLYNGTSSVLLENAEFVFAVAYP